MLITLSGYALAMTLGQNSGFGRLPIQILLFVSIAGVIIFPFFPELVKDYHAAQVGLIMMVMPISMGLLAPIAGSLSDRFGPRGISLIGLILSYPDTCPSAPFTKTSVPSATLSA